MVRYHTSHSRRLASQAVDHVIDIGRAGYDRCLMLPRIIPVGPEDIAGSEPDTTRRIVGRLTRALRIERARGRAGHWTYDLNRHIGILQALKAEQERLAALERGTSSKPHSASDSGAPTLLT